MKRDKGTVNAILYSFMYAVYRCCICTLYKQSRALVSSSPLLPLPVYQCNPQFKDKANCLTAWSHDCCTLLFLMVYPLTNTLPPVCLDRWVNEWMNGWITISQNTFVKYCRCVWECWEGAVVKWVRSLHTIGPFLWESRGRHGGGGGEAKIERWNTRALCTNYGHK